MKIGTMGKPYFFNTPGKHVSFDEEETLLDFDVINWNPNTLIEDYFSSDKIKPRRKNNLIILDQEQLERIVGDIRRRDEELRRLLKLGRVICINLPAPQMCYLGGGNLINMLEYFTFVKMPTSAGSGDNIDFKGGEPFTSLWEKNKENFIYQAYFSEVIGQPLFFIHGSPLVIGSYLKVENGHVVFLPVLKTRSDRFKAMPIEETYIESLMSLTAELKKTPGDFELPGWSASYVLSEELEQRKQLLLLEEELNALKLRVNQKQSLIAELERNKILFTGTGRVLELQVKKIFEDLGFDVTEGEPGRDDLILKYGDKVAVVEIKGVARKSAAESHARQLEQWVSAYDAAHEDVKAKGILVVNTFKETPLRDRTEVSFPTQMRPYSEAREHCLMTGLQLLGFYLDCKDNEDKKNEMIDCMFATKGVFSEYQDWTDFLLDENINTPG